MGLGRDLHDDTGKCGEGPDECPHSHLVQLGGGAFPLLILERI